MADGSLFSANVEQVLPIGWTDNEATSFLGMTFDNSEAMRDEHFQDLFHQTFFDTDARDVEDPYDELIAYAALWGIDMMDPEVFDWDSLRDWLDDSP